MKKCLLCSQLAISACTDSILITTSGRSDARSVAPPLTGSLTQLKPVPLAVHSTALGPHRLVAILSISDQEAPPSCQESLDTKNTRTAHKKTMLDHMSSEKA